MLQRNLTHINMNALKQFPEYLEFLGLNTSSSNGENVTLTQPTHTPDEILENAYLEIRRELAQQLLMKIKHCSASFFERLVVELLVRMGYGGSIKDAGETTRLTNDEGIDGIIKEDKLGLDVIYIQAKRWTTQSVGRPEIQSFVGALDGKRANKGVFITTSRFNENAREYIKSITKKVILIDGEQFANYMIDYGLGVSVITSYDLKKIDNDYFEE
jgi:restriction system protein